MASSAGHTRGDVDVDGVHVDVIAPPLKWLAVRDKFQAGLIGNGAGGSVLTWNPFRIEQR